MITFKSHGLEGPSMRFTLLFAILLFVASCAADEIPEPSANDTAPPVANATDDERPANDTVEGIPPDIPPIEPIPDPADPSTNLSEEWIVGVDESGDPLIVEPRARLGESFLGIVPSSDPTPRIVSFSLIDPSVNRVIAGYENMTGTVRIDRERVPRRLALRANYAGEVGSVLFSLDDAKNHRVENAPPFALHGVDFHGRYGQWTPDRGRYVITATPFEGSDGVGPSRDPTTLTIEFFAPGYLDRVSNP